MFLHFQLLFTKTNENSPTEKQTTANQNYYFKNLRTLITIIRRTKKTHIKYYLLQSPNVIYLFGHIVFVKKTLS